MSVEARQRTSARAPAPRPAAAVRPVAAVASPRPQRLGEPRGSRPPAVTPVGPRAAHLARFADAAGMIQQRGRGPDTFERREPSPVLDFFARQANHIPGFRMFTVVLGVNPIDLSRVDRGAANLLRAVVELVPGGGLIVQALETYGVFDRAGRWIEQQLASLGISGASILAAVDRFVDSLSWRDLFDLGGVWDRACRIFTDPIDRIIRFAGSLVAEIIRIIKDAILRPLAALASQTRAWDLLCAVLGRNPITGDPVPRTAETLIGGFMRLIGQEEIWENLQRGNAVARAWAWFQGALGGLIGFVGRIPQLFLTALRELEIADLVLLPRAFLRIGRAFGNFIGDFLAWAGTTIWNLLEIIFSVVAPGVLVYLQRARGAFRTILRDPIGFVGNLVRAGVQGLRQFAASFLTHLRASLIGWLTGALSGANIYIPQGLSLREIIQFVLSVLGLTWQNVRRKLVRVIGEPAVGVLETTFDLVMTLVTQGPAAAWERIQESLSNLRELVLEQIMTFVRDRVVQAAIARLVTSLNPAGAFIQAVIATYDTIMFFVERLRQIAQVAASVIDSLAAIAGGAIGAAANRIEQTLAGLLTLVISFLARIAGLGRVGDAITSVVDRVRRPIDRALDRVVDWIVAQARHLGRLAGGGRSHDERWNVAVQALQQELTRLRDEGTTTEEIQRRLPVWQQRFGFSNLTLQTSETAWDLIGSMSAARRAATAARPGDQRNPFGLRWPKPAASAYPIIYLGGVINRIKSQSILQGIHARGHRDETGLPVQAYAPTSRRTLPGGETIGLGADNRIAVGTVIGPLSTATTPGGRVLLSVLRRYGFDATAEGKDGDHVKEIQFGGRDALDNLWPLDLGINRSSGSILSRAIVTYPSGRRISISELRDFSSRRYYFRITSTL